jgi:hypothetical protein
MMTWLALAATIYADDEEEDATSAPTLTPARTEVSICSQAGSGGRFLEIRGIGFDGWVDQRLPGVLLDQDGNQQARWRSIWVDPTGRLTVEVNLCEDPNAGRGSLAPGTYQVAISDGSGGDPIATTSFDLLDQPPPAHEPLPSPPVRQPPASPAVVVPPPDPTGFTPAVVPPYVPPSTVSSTSAPRTGPGSREQPLPLGSPLSLSDGWQVTITGVTPDGWSGIHDAVPSNKGPAPNLQFFVLRVQAVYNGTGSALFSGLRLGLASPSSTYDEVNNGCGLISDPLLPTLVGTGGVVRGNVCFAVRTSDAGQVVVYDTLAAEPDRVYELLR